MMGVAAIAYKLIPPQSFMTAYYTVYRSFPLLQELAAHGITLSLLLYLLSLLLLLVFMGICPSHKTKGNKGVIKHEA